MQTQASSLLGFGANSVRVAQCVLPSSSSPLCTLHLQLLHSTPRKKAEAQRKKLSCQWIGLREFKGNGYIGDPYFSIFLGKIHGFL